MFVSDGFCLICERARDSMQFNEVMLTDDPFMRREIRFFIFSFCSNTNAERKQQHEHTNEQAKWMNVLKYEWKC